MNFRSIAASVVLGAGLGAALLPAMASAATSASPGVVHPGGSVAIHVTCGPSFAGKASITGPGNYAADVILHAANDGVRGTVIAPSTVGVYKVAGYCDGTASGSTTFTVSPMGGPMGGDGGRSGNSLLIIAGMALVGASAGGLIVMRRKAVASTSS